MGVKKVLGSIWSQGFQRACSFFAVPFQSNWPGTYINRVTPFPLQWPATTARSLVKSHRLWQPGFLDISPAWSILYWTHRSKTHAYITKVSSLYHFIDHFNRSLQFVSLFLSKKSYFILSWYIGGGGIGRQNLFPSSFHLTIEPSSLSFHLSSLDSTLIHDYLHSATMCSFFAPENIIH